ncbi:DUF72 domain-containing protein [Caulobacter sp. S45]|uniref:DUF72 domain-containing protein n=1 Tax=Caulobacter sp. S45 TaxID=1641861 RepID=UPI0020B14C93|nr:DUF72 domain-containing protein [Caulobacter sp. S45]
MCIGSYVVRCERGAALALPELYVGVAGWTIPAPIADRFDHGGSHLERYASRFNAVEINSSFYRPHRRSTYERWAASVPDRFRFAVKLPKTITHEHRLCDCSALLERFAGEVIGLGGKRGPILVQLPPSLGFEFAAAQRFLTEARHVLGGAIVCEPRHMTWFSEEADALLAAEQVARVVADPAVTPAGSSPGGWRRLAYFRLHGSPRIYWSDYPDATINRQAMFVRNLSTAGHDVWTIFDNTATGRAPVNALALVHDLAQPFP